MPCPRVVVIGASAGGLEVVRLVLGALPPNFPAAVLVVIHTGPDGPNLMPRVLARATSLGVSLARDGAPFRRGHVYLPPPDHHLLLERFRLKLSRGPRQHGLRPAVDPLFTSAARECGAGVIGVVLSGALGDGTLGLMAVKGAGGVAIVQDPEESVFSSMPLTALKNVEVDEVLAPSAIGPRLAELVMRAPRAERGLRTRRRAPRTPRPPAGAGPSMGEVTTSSPLRPPVVCPSCGGALTEENERGVPVYACHVGHRFSAESLHALQREEVERALWSGVRALEEDAILRQRMADHAEARGMPRLAAEWRGQAVEARSNVGELRRVVEEILPPPASARRQPGGREATAGRRRAKQAARSPSRGAAASGGGGRNRRGRQ